MMPNEIISDLRKSCACDDGRKDPRCLFCEARLQIESTQLIMRFLHQRLAESNRRGATNNIQRKLILQAMGTLKSVNTGEDCDDAYMRIALRILAEVIGEPLDGYRLLKEAGKSVKPLYYHEPQPESGRRS